MSTQISDSIKQVKLPLTKCAFNTDNTINGYLKGARTITRGIYTAATGMMANQSVQDVIAENLANSSTNGYKRGLPVLQSFADALATNSGNPNAGTIGSIGHGVMLNRVATDFAPGGQQSTGNPYDVALTGDAALVIQQKGQVVLTRDGALARNAQGILVQSGSQSPVLDVQGKQIVIPNGAGTLSISGNGTISVDKTVIAQLQLRALNSSVGAVKVGDNAFAAQVNRPPSANSGVRQGFIESSNVSVVKEMVQMITGMRAYETNAKMLRAEDEVTARAITDVAKM